MRNLLLLATAIVLGLTASVIAQTNPHHPQGAPAPEAETTAETPAPPMNCRDMMGGMMGMMGAMTGSDGPTPMQAMRTMQMMHMMQMMIAMQTMHEQLMQQMQKEAMPPSGEPNKGGAQ
jgi:predicted lipid-binding transport protein (Tim44 family)